MNDKQRLPKNELITLAVGETLAVLLTVLGFWLVDAAGLFDFKFSYKVVTGAILGAAVILLNFLFLSFSVNRAVDEFLALRGDREMTEEEAEAFAAEHSMGIQNAAKKSMIVRTATIAVTLVIAFLLDWFNPLATVIPIIAYQPIITWGNYLREKWGKIKLTPKEAAVVEDMKADIADGEAEHAEAETKPAEAEAETAEEPKGEKAIENAKAAENVNQSVTNTDENTENTDVENKDIKEEG